MKFIKTVTAPGSSAQRNRSGFASASQFHCTYAISCAWMYSLGHLVLLWADIASVYKILSWSGKCAETLGSFHTIVLSRLWSVPILRHLYFMVGSNYIM